jgi:hypothetical protein
LGEGAEGAAGATGCGVPRVGDPVRIRASGVEIEGIIADASTAVLRVKVKATALKMKAMKPKRERSA